MLPDVLAMLFADNLYRDGSGKYTVQGTFSTIGVPFFPWTQSELLVYLAFTDGKGKYPLHLRLVDAENKREPIFDVEQTLRMPSLAGAVAEIAFYATNVDFPEAGDYRLQIWQEKLLLRERSLRLYRADVNGRLRK